MSHAHGCKKREQWNDEGLKYVNNVERCTNRAYIETQDLMGESNPRYAGTMEESRFLNKLRTRNVRTTREQGRNRRSRHFPSTEFPTQKVDCALVSRRFLAPIRELLFSTFDVNIRLTQLVLETSCGELTFCLLSHDNYLLRRVNGYHSESASPAPTRWH